MKLFYLNEDILVKKANLLEVETWAYQEGKTNELSSDQVPLKFDETQW
jgi:hypothetical protein